jgi:hypothetical protein
MVLGLLDHTTYQLLGQTTFRASGVRDSFTWVKAASSVKPRAAHPVLFIAEFNSRSGPLSTDWFIDEAMLVPAGSPAPAEITPAA